MKNIVKLENYYYPDELRNRLEEYVNFYNHHRYYESLGNIAPADFYSGKHKAIINRRKELKIKTINERRKYNQKTKESA